MININFSAGSCLKLWEAGLGVQFNLQNKLNCKTIICRKSMTCLCRSLYVFCSAYVHNIIHACAIIPCNDPHVDYMFFSIWKRNIWNAFMVRFIVRSPSRGVCEVIKFWFFHRTVFITRNQFRTFFSDKLTKGRCWEDIFFEEQCGRQVSFTYLRLLGEFLI